MDSIYNEDFMQLRSTLNRFILSSNSLINGALKVCVFALHGTSMTVHCVGLDFVLSVLE